MLIPCHSIFLFASYSISFYRLIRTVCLSAYTRSHKNLEKLMNNKSNKPPINVHTVDDYKPYDHIIRITWLTQMDVQFHNLNCDQKILSSDFSLLWRVDFCNIVVTAAAVDVVSTFGFDHIIIILWSYLCWFPRWKIFYCLCAGV